jgi:HEAT repeat protein
LHGNPSDFRDSFMNNPARIRFRRAAGNACREVAVNLRCVCATLVAVSAALAGCGGERKPEAEPAPPAAPRESIPAGEEAPARSAAPAALPPAVAAALKQLSSDDEFARAEAALALAELREAARPALAAIEDGLRDPSPEVRAHLLHALAAVKGKEAIPQIRPFLRDEDISVRKAALEAAGALDDPDGVPVLLAGADDDVAVVRATAIAAMGRQRAPTPEMVEALRNALSDLDETVMRQAILAVDKLQIEEAAGDLADKLRDQSGEIRATAARALGSLGTAPERAIDALFVTLDDDEPPVRGAAFQGLSALLSPAERFGYDPDEPDAEKRRAAIEKWKAAHQSRARSGG